MTYSFYSKLELLLLLLGLVSWSSLALSLVKMSGISASALSKTVFLSLALPNLTRIFRLLASIGLGILIGVPLGRRIEAHQRESNVHTLYGLTVTEQPAPREYVFAQSGKGEFRTVFCEDVPFRKGLQFKELTYVDKGHCWTVKDSKLGSYHFAQGGNPDGWNTNPNTDSHSNAYAVAYPAR